ncbi:hypothetical protein ACE1SV_39310 [Streptomyces sennicomposti]
MLLVTLPAPAARANQTSPHLSPTGGNRSPSRTRGTTTTSRRPARCPTGGWTRPRSAWSGTGSRTSPAPDRSPYGLAEAGSRAAAYRAGQVTPPAPCTANEIFAEVVAGLTGGDPAGGGHGPFQGAERRVQPSPRPELVIRPATPATRSPAPPGAPGAAP